MSTDFWKIIELWLESKLNPFTICEVILELRILITKWLNQFITYCSWVNGILTHQRLIIEKITLIEFIDLLKGKLESIKLTCTLNERGAILRCTSPSTCLNRVRYFSNGNILSGYSCYIIRIRNRLMYFYIGLKPKPENDN